MLTAILRLPAAAFLLGMTALARSNLDRNECVLAPPARRRTPQLLASVNDSNATDAALTSTERVTRTRIHTSRLPRSVVALAACLVGPIVGQFARAAAPTPSTVFAQVGFGDQKTDAYVVGATWNLPWQYDLSFGTVNAYVEAAFGRWHTAEARTDATAWPTQLSAVPDLRIYPAFAPKWFLEIGAGPSYILPLFRTSNKRFSSEFNFDDHAAIGVRIGHSEVSLRAEHFSNAGISRPNPGENFGEVRYAYRF